MHRVVRDACGRSHRGLRWGSLWGHETCEGNAETGDDDDDAADDDDGDDDDDDHGSAGERVNQR
eukprot:6195960-Pyramimonas_sp.AAC.1